MGGYNVVPLRSLQDVMRDVHAVAEVFPLGHFIYTSGMHGTCYVNYRPLKAGHDQLLREVCVHLLRKALIGINVSKYRNILAVGPETMGAKMIGQIVRMSENEMPYSIDTRTFLKDPADSSKFIWNADPKRVLTEDTLLIWMDDLLNLASTFEKTTPMINAYGAKVHTLAVVGDRSTVTKNDIEVEQIVSLERFALRAHSEDACPNCLDKIPVVNDLGHGKKWQDSHPDYPGGFRSARQ